MTEHELEDKIDELILESGLSTDDVAGVLESMAMRYREEASA